MHCRGGGQVERQRIVRAGRDRHVQALGGRPRLAAAEPEVDVRDDGVPTGVIVERSKCQSSSSTPGFGPAGYDPTVDEIQHRGWLALEIRGFYGDT
jgi:hypothetical protein